MPYKDFTEELTRLQSANIGAGFILQAQAEAMKRQDQATINTMALFNQSKSNLDNELRTTDEQLKEIQESDVFKEGVDTIDKMASNYEAMLNTSLIRQKKITEIYQSAIRDLNQIQSPESVQMAQTLTGQLPTQLELEQQRMNIPLNRIKFQNEMNGILKSKIDIEKNQIELNQIKQDIDVMEKVDLVLNDPNSGWQQLYANLKFNKNTGVRGYVEEKKEFMENVFLTLKDDPLVGRVMRVLDDVIEKNVRDYDPPVFAPSSNASGLEKLQKNEEYLLGLHNWLRNTSMFATNVETSPVYSNVRANYKNTALTILQEKGIEPTSKEAEQYLKFGASPVVLARMKAQSKTFGEADVVEFQGGWATHADVANYIYQTKYNNDPENEQYYPNLYKRFKIMVTGGSDEYIPPIRKLTQAEITKLTLEGKLKQEGEQINGAYYTRSKRTVNLLSGPTTIDFSELMSFEGKWFNPYDYEAYNNYVETDAERKIREEQAKQKLKEETTPFLKNRPNLNSPYVMQ